MADRTPWERVQIARDPSRPKTLDYIAALMHPWVELHGDRIYGDDPAIIAGIGTIHGKSVVVVGHQRGSNTKENVTRNFGMPRPEGYRKTRRVMELAGKFSMPLVCFVDTPAADPGPDSEERGQSQAIAESLYCMAGLPVPVVVVVIGEGGSGGALAISMGDRMYMLENSVYSVASPEACATILWHDAAKAPEAAERLKLTAQDLLGFGIVDGIVPEPPDGAHTDPASVIKAVGETIKSALCELDRMYANKSAYKQRLLLQARSARYRRIGSWREESPAQEITTDVVADL